MGKSVRSKIKKRLRTVKRERVDAMVITPREIEKNQALHRVIEGRAVTLSKPKNAFKHPSADGAVFPQHEVMKPIDYRAQNLPMAGYVFRGNRRKYTGEQKEFMENLKKTSHPKMEVLAGGGAILARDGRRISLHEAEILATAAAGRPEAAALAASAVSSAASAVAAAVSHGSASSSGGAAGDAEMDGNEEVEHPLGAADHSRRPIVKDNRRVARTAELQPRRISAKKKAKGKRQALGFSVDGDDAEEAPAPEPVKAAPAKVKTDAAAAPATTKKVKKKSLKKKKSGAAGEAAMDEDDE